MLQSPVCLSMISLVGQIVCACGWSQNPTYCPFFRATVVNVRSGCEIQQLFPLWSTSLSRRGESHKLPFGGACKIQWFPSDCPRHSRVCAPAPAPVWAPDSISDPGSLPPSATVWAPSSGQHGSPATGWVQSWWGLVVSHRILKEEEEKKRDREKKSKGELLLGTSWKLWTYSISDLRVDNLSKEGRALTVTNNYFWQPLNSQTYCPGSGQLSYGSIQLGQLRQEIHIKLQNR